MKTKNKTQSLKVSGSKALATSPRDVFLHLLMMVMLYLGVISLISLSFAYINFSFPDDLNYYRSGILGNIRFHSSMLVVSFPLLLIFSSFIQSDFRKNPAKHELKFSKWLIYLTLFLSALTIVVDLIQLVHRFYGGELTTPFLLKVASVLVIAGGVFGYYLWHVQRNPAHSNIPKIAASVTTILTLGVLALGFFIVGSPAHQRQIRMDERRVSDLQALQGEIMSHWQAKRVLPKTLLELSNEINGFRPPVDPETEQPYEYSVLEPLKFNLCAVFKQETLSEEIGKSSVPVYYDYRGLQNWEHGKGKVCFERTIDPKLYPKP